MWNRYGYRLALSCFLIFYPFLGQALSQQTDSKEKAKFNLSKSQQQEIKALVKKEREALAPILEKLRDGRRSLRLLALNDEFDKEKVKALATQQGKLYSLITLMKVRTQYDMYRLMDKRQKEIIRNKLKAMKKG